MLLRRTSALFLALAMAAAGAEPPSQRVLERYKQMLAASPVEGMAFERLWTAYEEAGQTAALIQEYEGQQTFAGQMILGALLRKADRPDEAAAAFSRAAAFEPKSPLPLMALGQLRAGQGRHGDAAAAYEAGSKLLSDDDLRLPETLMLLGTEQFAAGAADKAADSWERTVALNPQNLDLRRRLAEAYVRHGLGDRAVPHLEFLAANAEPADRPRALEDLARVHEMAGRMDAAVLALEQAVELTTPENWMRRELQDRIIRLYERAHRTAELEERSKRAAAENPRDLGGALQLIELYERLGDMEQQRVGLEKVVALAPKNSGYRMRLARLLVQMDQPDAALPVYDKLLAEQPENADLVFERAALDIRRMAPEPARARISAFLAAHSGDEAARARALDFFDRNHFDDLAEKQRIANAAKDGDDAILALADFYFQQHREDDGGRQLGRLIHAGDSSERQAAAWLRAAQALKGRNLLEKAIDATQKAVALAGEGPPETAREGEMLLGELEEMSGRHDRAEKAFAGASQWARTDAEAEEADRKRFDALRQPSVLPSPAPQRGKVEMTLPPPQGETQEAQDPAVAKVIGELANAAEARPTAAAWLRVARWHLWAKDSRAAAECANKALALDPASLTAHEFLIKLAALEPGSPLAAAQLAILEELDPSHRADYRRRAAQWQMQAGHPEEGLKILQELVRTNPGNADLLTELAGADEHAERWRDAAETWQKVLASAPGPRKREALAALVRSYGHLNEPKPAAELLLRQIEASPDLKEQTALFHELLAHCAKYGLLPWLQPLWEERRRLLADDYFTELAYGQLLDATGDHEGAVEALGNAALSASDPGEMLPELVREAENRNRLDAAIDWQERLARLSPPNAPEALERLAELQEKAFATEAAARTWQKVGARFPREAGALMLAAEFYLRSGDAEPAAALLRKLRELEPDNARALFMLASLDAESGARAEAEDCLERVLTVTPPGKAGEEIHFPGMRGEDGGALPSASFSAMRRRGDAEALRALRGFWAEPIAPGKGDAEMRLHAIRALARLIRADDDAAALQKWTERWKGQAGAQPSEALWALFHADAGEAVLDALQAMFARDAENKAAKQAFLWLGLQTGQFTRIGTWMSDPSRTAGERDFFIVALGQYLEENGGVLDPALVDGLFPPEAKSRLWQAAEVFGSRGLFAAAARLGDRAFAQPDPQRLLLGRELAKWHLGLGRVAEASRILRQIASEKAETFDSPVFQAMRDEWLLLPEAERQGFTAGLEQDADPRTQPIRAALTRLLLHGLAGEETPARADVSALLRLRPLEGTPGAEADSAVRGWNFLLTTGLSLQAWKLDSLAIDLWEKALADTALLRLQGAQAQEVAKEIRTHLFALKIAHAGRPAVAELLSSYLSGARADGATPLAEALENLEARVRALQVYREIWEHDRANQQVLRDLLAACRAAGDIEMEESVLRTALSHQAGIADQGLGHELILQLADLLEKRGDAAGAIATLRDAAARGIPEPRLLVTLAETQERAGLAAAAEETWRRLIALDPAHTAARVALASLLQRQGKFPAALAALERASGVDAMAKLSEVLFQSGRQEDAVAAIERIPASNQSPAVLELVKRMLDGDARAPARALLREAMTRTTDPVVLMRMQEDLLDACSPREDRPMITRELRKLRLLAGGNTARLGAYFAYVQTHAADLQIEEFAERELTEAWAGGAGPLPAGAVLLAWNLDPADPGAEPVLTQLLERSDADEPWLRILDSSLRAAHRLNLSAKVEERLVELNPADDDRIIAWVRTLAEAGRKPEALAALAKWSARAPLDDAFAAKAAQLWAELGEPGRAEPLFTEAVRGDPFVRDYQARLNFARLRIAQGDFPAARKLLLNAFENPQNRSYDELAQYLVATHKEGRVVAELADFHFSESRMNEVRLAVLSKLNFQTRAAP